MQRTERKATTYRADIDGLRAIAVLAVLAFHADIGLPGGYVGVDVFFVISGFLITGLILKDLEAERFSLLRFWERRIRRILPALALVLLFCLVAGAFFLLPLDYAELGRSAIAQALLSANFYFWRESGYFAQAAEMRPLLHTWSLAVEEQFYLLFPLFLVGWRRLAPAARLPAMLLVAAGSFGLSVYASYFHPAFNFYLLPTRAWELLIGALLAALPARRSPRPWLAELLGILGLAAILTALLFFDRGTRFPGLAALLPCAGVAALIWANSRTSTATGRLLAMKPLVGIGLISYSLYLWHWPLLVFAKYRTLDPVPVAERLLLLALALGLAGLSWRWVETPFRRRTLFASRGKIFAFAAGTTSLLLLFGLSLVKLEGLPSRLPAEAQRYADAASDRGSENELSLDQVEAGQLIELGARDPTMPVDFLLWGDSHAMAIVPILDLLGRENGLRGAAATHSAMTPLLGYEDRNGFSLEAKSAAAFKEGVLDFVRSRQVRHVVLAARWDYYLDSDQGTSRLRHHLLATLEKLRAEGAEVLILRQVPKQPWDVPRALALTVFSGGDAAKIGGTCADHRAAMARQDPLFADLENLVPGTQVLDSSTLFVQDSDAAKLRVAVNGVALYRDADHLTAQGSLVLRPLFEPYFTSWSVASRVAPQEAQPEAQLENTAGVPALSRSR